MTANVVRLGPVYWVCGLLGGLLLTFAVVFLQIVEWSLIAPTFFIAWCGGNLIIAVAGRVGMTREGLFSSNVMTATVLGLLLLAVESWFIGEWFKISMSAMPTDIVLVNVLFAIYEETLFLGVAVAGKAGGLPDTYIIGISILAFVPYHFFRYPLDALMYILLLGSARFTMDVVRATTDHSDPSYLVHMIWNILASIF